jgi:beta-1,4-mannosyl-glycoprotein beta-1,4-N-acetylglucosaminyltransferase
MIIDCIMFNDEISMLKSRLNYLKPIVTKTILVEGNVTFSGKSKPLIFEENKEQFKEYNIENISLKINPNFKIDTNQPLIRDPNHSAWKIEFFQRNILKTKIPNGLNKDDLVIIGDLDEIPNKNIFQMPFHNPTTLCMEEYWYNTKFRNKEYMLGSTIVPGNCLNKSFEWYRQYRKTFPKYINAGWHLTFFMSPQKILEKLQAYSHQEKVRQIYSNLPHINECIAKGKHLFEELEHSKLEILQNSTIPNELWNEHV